MARILVVEDRAVNRHLLATLLGYAHHEVDEATDGVQALERVRRQLPDLVVTDIAMPNMDGRELVRRLRADPGTAGIPVIFYSASYRVEESHAIAKKLGVRWLLSKPSEPEAILEAVREALASRGGDALEGAPRDAGFLAGRLSSLLEASAEFASSRRPDELVRILCGVTQELLGATLAGAAMDGEAGGPPHAHARGFEDGRRAALEDWLCRGPFGARVRAGAVPVRMRPGDDLGLPAAIAPPRALLALPVQVRGLVAGWIFAAHREPGSDFADDDEGVARIVAAQFALAWENATLWETLERRVAERTAQLEMANRELEAFNQSLSHELRTPLRAIDGFSLFIAEECGHRLDPEASDALARVRAASQHLGRLLDELLELLGVTRGALHATDVDMTAAAREVAYALQEKDPARLVRWHIAEGLRARADPRLAKLALHNLLGNAWKFTSTTARAEIRVGTHSNGGGDEYFVADNGAGFDMRYANRLFNPFQRLHATDQFPGSGMGLAIVDRIVRRHGGRIRVEAKPGEGATFFFTLGDAHAAEKSP